VENLKNTRDGGGKRSERATRMARRIMKAVRNRKVTKNRAAVETREKAMNSKNKRAKTRRSDGTLGDRANDPGMKRGMRRRNQYGACGRKKDSGGGNVEQSYDSNPQRRSRAGTRRRGRHGVLQLGRKENVSENRGV
jgi:hypothetical protein